MLSHEEMIKFQANEHFLIEAENFQSKDEYVLQLLHVFAYTEVARLAEIKKVLDLGCNTGFGTAILSKAVSKVVGVDVSEKALSFARNKYAELGIEFRKVDGEQLPFHDGEFDTVVSFQVIEHVIGYDKYISEIKRVLSPKGIVVFTTPNSSIRLDPGMKPLNPLHHREFTALELKSLLDNFFPNVSVFGLFAADHIYSIEFNRVHSALIKARIKRMAPKFMLTMARRLRDSLAGKRKREKTTFVLDKEFINQSRIEHLYYRRDNLAKSLDLLAICADDRETFESFQRQFVEGDKR